MNQLISVPFHQDNLVLINNNNEPFVAMKPIVVQMGLIWAAQYVKIMEKFDSVVSIIETTGEDGKIYNMICLPLKKLPAWLYSISPNKVKPEIRDKIIQYQDECDDVLWQYWTKGFVGKPDPMVSTKHILLRNKLANLLENERHPIKRAMIHEELQLVSNALGLTAPAIESLGYTGKAAALAIEFWEFYEDHQEINVSRDQSLIAINISMILADFSEYMGYLINRMQLRRALESSDQPQYLGYKSVNSRMDGKILRCLVFESNK